MGLASPRCQRNKPASLFTCFGLWSAINATQCRNPPTVLRQPIRFTNQTLKVSIQNQMEHSLLMLLALALVYPVGGFGGNLTASSQGDTIFKMRHFLIRYQLFNFEKTSYRDRISKNRIGRGGPNRKLSIDPVDYRVVFQFSNLAGHNRVPSSDRNLSDPPFAIQLPSPFEDGIRESILPTPIKPLSPLSERALRVQSVCPFPLHKLSIKKRCSKSDQRNSDQNAVSL